MSADIPPELRYTKEHEWARADGEHVVVGITRHAVEQLGDITMVSLPDVGASLSAGESFGDIDSVKAVSELFAPMDGTVVEHNVRLEDAPEQLNESPYTEGWILKLKPTDADALGALMSAEQYAAFIADEG